MADTLSTLLSNWRSTNQQSASKLLSKLKIGDNLYDIKDPGLDYLAEEIETRLKAVEETAASDGTVKSVSVEVSGPIANSGDSTITSTGTISLSHATSGVATGTYTQVTVDQYGHVTAGDNPTTLAGYGITDANINNGVITLGATSITPVTEETQLSLGTATGDGNAVTSVSVNGHEITLVKGETFITATGALAYGTTINYDSTEKEIYLKNSAGTTLATIDATDFIKDGMVDTVTITTPTSGDNAGQQCLVITFNEDSGNKEDIEIPIDDIFDADNYYTKTAVNALLDDKQDTLVSGTNIKTVGGETLLGSGNVAVVTSFNGETGAVVGVSSFNGATGAVVGVSSFNGETGAVTYTAPVTSVNGATGAVTIEVGVTSFNGETGAVVGVSSFNGATGAVTYTAPVDSVNGYTGAVVLTGSDIMQNSATGAVSLDSAISTINTTLSNKANKAAFTTATVNNWSAAYTAGSEQLTWTNTETTVYVPNGENSL